MHIEEFTPKNSHRSIHTEKEVFVDNQDKETDTPVNTEESSMPIGTIALVGFLMAIIGGVWLAMYLLYLFRGGQG